MEVEIEVDYKGKKITRTVSNSLEKFENISAAAKTDKFTKIADHLSKILQESFGKLIIKTDNVLNKILK